MLVEFVNHRAMMGIPVLLILVFEVPPGVPIIFPLVRATNYNLVFLTSPTAPAVYNLPIFFITLPYLNS